MPLQAVVIGAGVVGAALAAELVDRGANVTLLDAGTPGRGTSSATFAWVNSNDKEPEAYHQLNVAGMQAHQRAARQWSGGDWYHPGGNVEWQVDDDARAGLERKVERLRGLGYQAEWLSRAEVAAREPDLATDRLPADGFAVFDDEAWVDVPVLIGALLERVRSGGGEVVHAAHAEAIDDADGHPTVVTGARRLTADVVVNCAGPDAANVATLAGVHLPIREVPGLIVSSEPAVVRLRGMLHTPRVNVRPEGGGRLMLHSTDADAGVGAGYTARRSSVEALLDAAAHVLPAASGLGAESVRVGVRPVPADGLPLLGPAPGVAGLYHVVTHSGVTLSLHLATVVADHLLTDREPDDYALYRLDEARLAQAASGSGEA